MRVRQSIRSSGAVPCSGIAGVRQIPRARAIGTMSALIGIRLSARTTAGAHITEARPPIKMRLRVSIEPPSNHLSEGNCPITTEWLFLSRKSSSWCLIGARLGGELRKRRRDSTRGQGPSTRTTLGRKPRRLSGPRNRRRPADNRRRRITLHRYVCNYFN